MSRRHTAKLTADGDVTIPAEVREAADLKEGDTVLVEATDGGVVIRQIDPDQAWFWTPEGQEKEREADQAIARGDVERYDTGEEFLGALDEHAKRPE